MSTPLYEISRDYVTAFNDLTELLESTEVENPEQLIRDSLAHLEAKFETKGLNIAMFIRSLQTEQTGVKDVIERLTKRSKSIDKQITWLQGYLLEQMQVMDIKKLSNDWLVVSIRNNPCRVIVNESVVPEKYKQVIQSISIDKKTIGQDLKNGELVEGCYLQPSQRLNIQ
jgi:hypothetical protein